MSKYTKLTDLEINKKVAEKVFGEDEYEYEVECTQYGVTINDDIFDPCNNPSDAMPIIIENEISMIKISSGWMCCHGSIGQVENENLYRGAMELFLMMKDKGNKND